jgi:hypothetical protein
MISAKDALLLTNSKTTEKAEKQLQKCQDAVERAAKNGLRTCTVFEELLNSVKIELVGQLGYDVKQHYDNSADQRESGYTTTISW